VLSSEIGSEYIANGTGERTIQHKDNNSNSVGPSILIRVVFDRIEIHNPQIYRGHVINMEEIL
jgi:hypothetical protein